MFTTSLPMLPPPPSSLLPSLRSSPNTVLPQQAQHPQRRPKPPPPSTNTPLALLAQDERLIAQRKMAIAMYGWSWIKPAGCAKTMLGLKEAQLEREEVEKQLLEVEMQERAQLEMDEAERQTRLQAQARAEATGQAPEQDERNLDDDVPDAEEHDLDDDIPEDEDEDEDEEELDLDDEVPEADVSGWHYDTRISPEPAEGETGITDDVERSHLGDGLQIPPMFHAGLFPHGQRDSGGMDYEDEQAIAEAMLEEDEMEGERDLDEEVPDADMDADEEGWEHTDTELEESEMDISILPAPQHQPPTQAMPRGQRGATPTTVESSVAGDTGRRSWLGGGSPRRNLFGRTNAGNASNAGGLFTPPQAVPTSPVLDATNEDSMRPRRFARGARRGVNLTPAERENRDSPD